MRFPIPIHVSCTALAALLLAGCTPTLDWRAVRLEPDARLQFPCKPDAHERSLDLDGQRVAARMLVCDAGEVTWSATQFTFADPVLASAAAVTLQRTVRDNLKASDVQSVTPEVPGATPGSAWRASIAGQRPDGSAVAARALLVARGARVYQLVVLARSKAAAGWEGAAQDFLDGLRWPL
ncbi:hypothetical protein ACWA7J_22170 [Leptothrix sp. BB-4]